LISRAVAVRPFIGLSFAPKQTQDDWWPLMGETT